MKFGNFSFMHVLAGHADLIDHAHLLAASASHNGDWLHALLLSACGLCLINDTVQATIGLGLGAKLACKCSVGRSKASKAMSITCFKGPS